MRKDPLSGQEWTALRAALTAVEARKQYGSEEYRAQSLRRKAACLDALMALGCHPSVLADPRRHNLTFKSQDGGLVAMWKRPKTRNWCLMPATDGLVVELTWYCGSPLTRKTIHRTVRECAAEAGLGDVGPLTIRHTVAANLVRRLGPSVAKESLAVGDRALQDYTALSAGTRLKAIRNLVQNEEG